MLVLKTRLVKRKYLGLITLRIIITNNIANIIILRRNKIVVNLIRMH